jgi:hypothetical protein
MANDVTVTERVALDHPRYAAIHSAGFTAH